MIGEAEAFTKRRTKHVGFPGRDITLFIYNFAFTTLAAATEISFGNINATEE